MSDIDFIVLDLDGGEMLARCVESIAAQTLRPARLIVLDNGSRTPSAASIPSSVKATILRSEENLGFAGGINRAMAEVRSPLVAWVNNDVVLAPSWAEEVSAVLAPDERIAAAQAIVMRPDGAVDGAGIDISDGTYRQVGFGEALGRLDPEPWGVSATAAIYRVAALQECAAEGEVLRSRFFAYYEDVELMARLREQGWRTALVPRPLAIHHGSSTRARLGPEALRLSVRNRYFVNRLHPGVGRRGAFLREDARRIAQYALSGRFAAAGRTAAAVIEGLF